MYSALGIFWTFACLVLSAWMIVQAFAGDQPPRPHDYRDGVISALQVQRNQGLDAVASLNATLVEKQDEIASLTEQLKVLSEKTKDCPSAADTKSN